MNVEKKLNALKRGSDDCLRYAQDIEAKFNDWLELVCEVHQVTAAKEGNAVNHQQDIVEEFQKMSIRAEQTQSSLKSAEEQAKIMRDTMESSKKTFEMAADAIPDRKCLLHIFFHVHFASTEVFLESSGTSWCTNGGFDGSSYYDYDLKRNPSNDGHGNIRSEGRYGYDQRLGSRGYRYGRWQKFGCDQSSAYFYRPKYRRVCL